MSLITALTNANQKGKHKNIISKNKTTIMFYLLWLVFNSAAELAQFLDLTKFLPFFNVSHCHCHEII